MAVNHPRGSADRGTGRGLYRILWLVGAATLAILALVIWVSDKVTLKGERTVYTVDCEHGVWQGARCNGRLVPAVRYRFRALKSRGEVIFWEAESSAPSGKFTDCAITNGRNWLCKPNADAQAAITLRMANGRAVASPGAPTRQFHAVPKWRWWLLRTGISLGGTTADN